MASHRETLNAFSNDNHPYQGEERSQQIAKDIRHAFDDGSAFGEYIASTVGEALAAFIDKSGLDGLVNNSIDGLKSVASEAAISAIQSEQFTSSLGLNLAQKEVDREAPSWVNSQVKEQQEMGS